VAPRPVGQEWPSNPLQPSPLKALELEAQLQSEEEELRLELAPADDLPGEECPAKTQELHRWKPLEQVEAETELQLEVAPRPVGQEWPSNPLQPSPLKALELEAQLQSEEEELRLELAPADDLPGEECPRRSGCRKSADAWSRLLSEP